MDRSAKLPGIALAALLVSALLCTGAPVRAATFQFTGEFVDTADPGSSPEFRALEGGTFQGTYSLPDGSLPGPRGGSLGIDSFSVTTRTPAGEIIFDFVSGRDFGAMFFDFFGPGTGDGFLFQRPDLVRMQIGVPTDFDGTGPITSDAIFSLGDAFTGGIAVERGLAFVPVPASLSMLGGALLLLSAIRLRRAGRRH